MAFINETPIQLLTLQRGCWDCLSDSEKFSAIIWLFGQWWADSRQEEFDLNELREQVACFNCESESALMSMLAELSYALVRASGALSESMTVTEIKAATKCWPCGIGKKEKMAMLVYLFYVLGNELVVSQPT